MSALTNTEKQSFKDLEQESKALIQRMEELLKEAYALIKEL
jgi:hypothetical protein